MPRMRATRNHYAPQLHSPCIYWGPFVCSTNRGPGDHPSDSIPSSTLSSFFYIPPCEQCRITDHPGEYPGPTIRALAEFTAWLAGREDVEVLYVQYREVVDQPAEQARAIAAFLDCGLDAERMAAVCDGRLYRQREQRK